MKPTPTAGPGWADNAGIRWRDLSAFDPEALGPAATDANDSIVARRGSLPPMYRILIASPEVAIAMEDLSTRLWNSSLGRAALEAVFLVVAHRLNCAEQWSRHVPRALDAGVKAACIDAIAHGRLPPTASNVRIVCQVAARLLRGQRIGARLWDDALRLHGTQGMAELCAFLGMATSVAVTIQLQQD